MKILIKTFILIVAATSLALAAPKRAALVICNHEYPGDPATGEGGLIRLDSVREDFQVMPAALKATGFEVVARANLTKEQMLAEIESFQKQFTGTPEVLFYFSGHGAQVQNENYLAAIDTNPDVKRAQLDAEAKFSGDELRAQIERLEQTAAEERAVPLRQVLAALQLMTPKDIPPAEKSKHVRIVILDACRSQFAPTVPTKSFVFKKGGLAKVDKAAGVFIGFAAAAEEEANTNLPGKPSLFTEKFAARLMQPGEIVNVFKDTRMKVNEAALSLNGGRRQLPAYYDELESSFSFVAPRPTEPSPDGTHPPPTPAIPDGPSFTGIIASWQGRLIPVYVEVFGARENSVVERFLKVTGFNGDKFSGEQIGASGKVGSFVGTITDERVSIDLADGSGSRASDKWKIELQHSYAVEKHDDLITGGAENGGKLYHFKRGDADVWLLVPPKAATMLLPHYLPSARSYRVSRDFHSGHRVYRLNLHRAAFNAVLLIDTGARFDVAAIARDSAVRIRGQIDTWEYSRPDDLKRYKPTRIEVCLDGSDVPTRTFEWRGTEPFRLDCEVPQGTRVVTIRGFVRKQRSSNYEGEAVACGLHAIPVSAVPKSIAPPPKAPSKSR